MRRLTPQLARAMAVAAPMPRDAPVTSAVFPLSSWSTPLSINVNCRVVPCGLRGRGCRWRESVLNRCCLLAQPVPHRIAIEQNALARVTQVTLTAELIHVVRDDLARSAYVL